MNSYFDCDFRKNPINSVATEPTGPGLRATRGTSGFGGVVPSFPLVCRFHLQLPPLPVSLYSLPVAGTGLRHGFHSPVLRNSGRWELGVTGFGGSIYKFDHICHHLPLANNPTFSVKIEFYLLHLSISNLI